jgi:tetratricopeptide (TPR) repeat protein
MAMKKIFKALDDELPKEEKKSQHLISMIRTMPDATPPKGFEKRVMSALPPPKRIPRWLRLYRLALTPQTVSVTPLKLATAVIGCVLAFFIATFVIDLGGGPRHALNSDALRVSEENFVLGRLHLATNDPEKALPYFGKAVASSPDVPDFHFWLGVAYWALNNSTEERNHYMQAIALDQDYIPAHLYLGHNFLDTGEWEQALAEYDTVLALDPGLLNALYNRGLALKNLGRSVEETIAWKEYLKVNQSGKWALRAAGHLNELGDFSYSIHQIGALKTVMKSPSFDSSDALVPDSFPSLDRLGYLLENNTNLHLHVVVYFKDNQKRAYTRAQAIKKYLARHCPGANHGRVKISWFACAEKIVVNNETHLLDESVRFIGLTAHKEKEVI